MSEEQQPLSSEPKPIVYITQKEMAAQLGVCTRTIARLIAAGKIGHYRPGSYARVPREDFETFKKESYVPAKSGSPV